MGKRKKSREHGIRAWARERKRKQAATMALPARETAWEINTKGTLSRAF